MKNYLKFAIYFFLTALIVLIFRSWLFPGLITAGDLWPYSNSIYSSRTFIPYAWDLNNGVGLGMFVAPLLWIYLNFGLPITILGKWLNLDWSIVERVWYLFPFLIFSFYFSKKLFSKVISNNNFSLLSACIFTLNTYILMVVGGGQIPGIGMAYSLIPLIIYLFINLSENLNSNKRIAYESILAGIMFSAQFIFDIRIAYITLFAVFILWFFYGLKSRTQFMKSIIFIFIIPGIVTFLLNAFWIIPIVLNGRNPVADMGSAYSSLSAVKFFSFAKFEDAISLLHPNWPENIFGKVGFLKPEFLLLPILAFSSLLFLKKEARQKKILIIFFITLGLLGVFLAKGANDPLGSLYLWLFNYLPGFIMFRDSSKWYVLIALSYSVLIPYSAEKIYEVLKIKKAFGRFIQSGFILVLILYFLFLIKPAIVEQLGGTFKINNEPPEYKNLDTYLSSQGTFFRTFWLPTTQRFAYYSYNHPAMPAQAYLNKQNPDDLINFLKREDAKKNLEEASVKYVIVPYDSQGEIFLKDRKYNNSTYLKTIKKISSIKWLRRIDGFGKIGVFQVESPKEHFWTNSGSLTFSYKFISPVEYEIGVRNAKIGDAIIFSESFDAKWFARDSGTKFYDWPNLISSNPYDKFFNSFVLRRSGNYSLIVYYYPQTFVNIGASISLISLILVIIVIIYFKRKI